ncbi:helix-turn-helix domain-containing protein [Winogradskyella luteola]|uniref:Helix-turn-helix transcriptional regulator n=1 Tax=Winogradskyella luteola TaxID=2828330 RepID=A0A9X1JT64_9FLAO|nr:AraC family transcriptional regulator [Winogradskyella luteola]MBV7270322.1 helix-turn-helix transcriptional regulator [Winogradskyella luteola]
MKKIYIDKYYDHFAKKVHSTAPDFHSDSNYMMRFNTHMKSYAYENNNLVIIFFKKGHGSIEWRNKRQTLNNDTFIVTNPSDGWIYLNEEEKCIDVLSLVVTKKLKKEFDTFFHSDTKSILNNPFHLKDDKNFFIEKTFSANHYPSGLLLKKVHDISLGEEFEFFDAEELSLTILDALHKDQIRAYRHANNINVKKQSTKIETLKRLLIAREYIHDNLDKKISLDELSNISCLSKFHLYSSFKTVFGKTPHQYSNSFRMMKAKEMLLSNQYSVSEVTDALGFNDIYSFSKLFKKAYKNPPSKLILK